MADTIELEISLNRTAAAGRYTALARLKLPGDSVPEDGNCDVTLDVERLAGLRRDAAAYGSALTDMLFGAPGVETPVKTTFLEARGEAARNPAVSLRLRLRFEREADELHALRWETLCDPDTRRSLATDAHVLFSRILQPTQSGEAPDNPPPKIGPQSAGRDRRPVGHRQVARHGRPAAAAGEGGGDASGHRQHGWAASGRPGCVRAATASRPRRS